MYLASPQTEKTKTDSEVTSTWKGKDCALAKNRVGEWLLESQLLLATVKLLCSVQMALVKKES